ncbi:MAG: DUF4333 domain-containing protein [Nocardioides sp.]|uniref:DUF4333 domain-containing protein n=1 Tax=Nocardioides sp. TaxID=35761 RepID=UPI0039E7042C
MRGTTAIAALVALGVVLLAGCKGIASTPKADVEKVLTTQLAQALGEIPSNVRCDDDLAGEKGSKQHCTFEDRGTTYGLTVKVTDNKGSVATDLDEPLPDFSAAKLELAVAQDYQKRNGAAPTTVHCAAPLSKTPGDHTTCDVTVDARSLLATVTVGETDSTTGVTAFTTTYQ